MRLGWVVFFVAAGVLGFELSLMRVLLVASWHHFAFLVISIVLLGFGASGTALSVLRARILPRGPGVLFALVLVAAVSMPLCAGLAQHVPIESRFAPALVGRQIGYWVIYWGLLAVPFFVAASAIGLSLMLAGQSVARVYAANLFGSAFGVMIAMAAMNLVPPRWMPLGMGAVVLMGSIGLQPEPRTSVRANSRRLIRLRRTAAQVGAWVGCVGIVVAQLIVDPPHIRVDPYKYGAYVQRLVQQGEAQRVAVSYGARAVVEAYRSKVFHDLPFLSLGVTPPAMTMLVADGHAAGSVLEINRLEDAAVMDRTMMAFSYALACARPRVLLLGETGGTNVWLAARHRSASIEVVQPDANVIALLRGSLHDRGGAVLDLPTVRIKVAQPRHFVEYTSERFDLIQLVTLESSAAGSGGVGGLAEDHLITVEGITACLEHLNEDGLLVATRGIQTPPRDNLKLFATFVAALRRVGVPKPEQHVVVVRDYLAVCTIAKASPWTPQQIERVRRTCAERELTPVWFTGIRPDELNQPDAMESPPDAQGDWYYHAATRLFSPSAEAFIRDWPFDIRPATDDRPFFLDFFKLTRLPELKQAFGDLWLTRTELAFLFVLGAIVVVGVVGAVLTFPPLLLVRQYAKGPRWGTTLLYFTAIGLGYMLLEMTFLSRLTRWVGDPVSAAAVTFAGFLLASGCGSLTAGRLIAGARLGSRTSTPARLIRWVIFGVVVVGLIEVPLLEAVPLSSAVGAWPYWGRCIAAFLATTPLGFLMGFPMPVALARLDRGAHGLIPWAWGANGFASVMAAPLAVAIGMTFGYTAAACLALALYVVPGLVFGKLPGVASA